MAFRCPFWSIHVEAQLEQEIVDLFYATIAEKRDVEDESLIVDNFVL